MPVISNTSSELVLSVILAISAPFHDRLTYLDQQAQARTMYLRRHVR